MACVVPNILAIILAIMLITTAGLFLSKMNNTLKYKEESIKDYLKIVLTLGVLSMVAAGAMMVLMS